MEPRVKDTNIISTGIPIVISMTSRSSCILVFMSEELLVIDTICCATDPVNSSVLRASTAVTGHDGPPTKEACNVRLSRIGHGQTLLDVRLSLLHLHGHRTIVMPSLENYLLISEHCDRQQSLDI